MEEFILARLPEIFDSDKEISSFIKKERGKVALKDNASCSPLRLREGSACEPDCNNVILLLEASEEIVVVGLDEWISDSSSQKCDYILFDAGSNLGRFALCELSCSLGKYVSNRKDGRKGKRAKALAQMQSVWQMIDSAENPALSLSVHQFRQKLAIFGWRERTMQHDNKAIRNMRGFSKTPGADIVKISVQEQFCKPFSFIQVKYPSVFHWDNAQP